MADVKIDIPGIGEVTADNAASESTLRELVKLMGAGGTGDNGSADNTKARKANTKATKEATEATEEYSSVMGSLTGGLLNSFVAGISAVVGMLPNLANELMFGGDKISDFTRHIPLGPIQGLIEAVEGQVDTFKELSSIGASFGNSMFGITKASAEAGMSQSDLIELLGNNADSLRRFGNTVSDGTSRFGRLSKELRQSTAGRDLMAMGISTQEINETLISFNDMMVLGNRRRFMSEAQLTQGTITYQKELDKIAKLTGKSRKQLQEENNERMKDIRMQMAVSRMGTDEAARFTANLSNAATMSPQFEQALVDMADGMPTDKITKDMMLMSDTFRKNAGNIQNMSAAEFQNFSKIVGQEQKQYLDRMGEQATAAMVQFNTGVADGAQVAGALAGVVGTTEEALAQEQEKRDKMTAEMTQISTTIADLRSKVILPIIESPMFQNMMDSFAGMIPSLEDSQTMFENLKTKFNDDFKPALDKIITFFKTDGLTTIQDTFASMSALLTDFMPKVTSFFDEFLKDPKGTFEKHIMPFIKQFGEDAVNSLGTTVVAGIAGYFSIKTLGVLFKGLFSIATFGNPIIAGITGALAGLFAIDQLLFDGAGTQMVKDTFNNIISGAGDLIKGLFSFDFELPNFKDYLPTWLGGKGLDFNFFGGGSTSSVPSTSDTLPEPEETAAVNTPEVVSPSSTAKQSVTSSVETELAMLNTTATEMRDLIQKSNSILKKLDGNMIG